MTDIEVDEAGATQPHPASEGDRVVIRLAETPSSGYRWQVDSYDPAAVTPAGDEFVPAADAMTGGGGTREFRFHVVTSDHNEVALSLRRAWEADTAAARLFRTAIN